MRRRGRHIANKRKRKACKHPRPDANQHRNMANKKHPPTLPKPNRPRTNKNHLQKPPKLRQTTLPNSNPRREKCSDSGGVKICDALMGARRPPNPPTAERGGANFWCKILQILIRRCLVKKGIIIFCHHVLRFFAKCFEMRPPALNFIFLYVSQHIL